MPRDKIRVIHSGVDRGLYSPGSASDGSPRANGRLRMGYLARLAPEKGLHVAVDAFLALADEFPNLELDVAGYEGRDQRKFQDKVRKKIRKRGLEERVRWRGTVDLEGKLDLLSSIDVLVVPTTYPDPKGLYALEAMASGVPFVVSQHGISEELVEATSAGLLAQVGDAESVAAKTRELLLDESLRRDMGARGLSAVETRFGSDMMARQSVALYRDLCAGHSTVESA
ncbi:MAG: glycosyltransferase family 4 protein [Planctomycetota bacterium]